MQDTVSEKILKFITDNFLFGRVDESLGEDDSFLEKGIIDSTGVLELVAFLEETYGIKVEDEELVPQNLDSVNKLINFIKKKTTASIVEGQMSP